jgi:hypothetical protein
MAAAAASSAGRARRGLEPRVPIKGGGRAPRAACPRSPPHARACKAPPPGSAADAALRAAGQCAAAAADLPPVATGASRGRQELCLAELDLLSLSPRPEVRRSVAVHREPEPAALPSAAGRIAAAPPLPRRW